MKKITVIGEKPVKVKIIRELQKSEGDKEAEELTHEEVAVDMPVSSRGFVASSLSGGSNEAATPIIPRIISPVQQPRATPDIEGRALYDVGKSMGGTSRPNYALAESISQGPTIRSSPTVGKDFAMGQSVSDQFRQAHRIEENIRQSSQQDERSYEAGGVQSGPERKRRGVYPWDK